MSSILHTRTFREAFRHCVARLPSRMTFAVPYIGTLPGWPSAVDFFRRAVAQGTIVSLVTKPPDTDRGTLDRRSARLIEQLGVTLLVRPRLHSKVYQFTFSQGDRNAFVGSANLSLGGFQRTMRPSRSSLRRTRTTLLRPSFPGSPGPAQLPTPNGSPRQPKGAPLC